MNFLDGPAVQGTITVGTSVSEAKIGASAFEDRKVIMAQAKNNSIFWSYDAGVTTSTGFELYPGTFVQIETGPDLPVYFVAASNTTVVLAEVA